LYILEALNVREARICNMPSPLRQLILKLTLILSSFRREVLDMNAHALTELQIWKRGKKSLTLRLLMSYIYIWSS